VLPVEPGQGLAEHLCLGAGHALREPGERRVTVARLRQRRQHQLGHVRLAGRGGPVPPGAAVPFPAREPLLRQPVKHRHHRRVSQALRQPVAYLPDGQRRVGPPEDFHDGTFEVAQPVHGDKSTVEGLSVTRPEVSAARGDLETWMQPTMIAVRAMISGSSHQPTRSCSLNSVTP